MRGGAHGTEYDAAAKLTRDGIGTPGAAAASNADPHESELVTLDGGRTTPLWPTVYWCLRCGDLGAAVRVMRKAATQHVGNPSTWVRLLAAAEGLHEKSGKAPELGEVNAAGHATMTPTAQPSSSKA